MRVYKRYTSVGLVTAISSMLMLFGCAPQFVGEPMPLKSMGWVERDVKHHHDVLADYIAPEIVYTDDINLLSPFERVRWIEGIDRQSTRIQQSVSLTPKSGEGSGGDLQKQELVRTHFIEVDPQTGELTLKGRLQLENFTAVSGKRYFVEFFYRGEMDEAKSIEMTARWVAVSKSLKEKGLNPKNIIIGGASYRQKQHGIILIEII